MAEDKEGELGRSQIIKCLGSHDKKLSILLGGTKKPQGNSFGMMSFIWMAEAEACSLTLLLFQCSSGNRRGRWAFSILRLGS